MTNMINALRLPSAAASPSAAGANKLWKQAQDFESVFMETMVEHLTSGLGTDGPVGSGGTGGEIYRSMLGQQFAKAAAHGSGIGLTDMVYRELMRMKATDTGSKP